MVSASPLPSLHVVKLEGVMLPGYAYVTADTASTTLESESRIYIYQITYYNIAMTMASEIRLQQQAYMLSQTICVVLDCVQL